MSSLVYSALRRMFNTSTTAVSPRLHVDEFTNPAAADADAFMTAANLVSAATAQTFLVASFNGAGHTAGALPYARNITFVFDAHTDWDATTVVVTGLDILGHAISEDFACASSASLTGVKAFKSVTSVAVPAQTGAGGTATMGFGALLGFSLPCYTRQGKPHIVNIVEAGVRVVTGTFATAAVGLPHGTYSAANAPDGSRDYVVTYEVDTSV